jgi:hypothetical protein
MTPTANQSIPQIQAQFRELVDYVTGPDSRAATAYEVELRLFRRLLALGAALLGLFFATRVATRPAGPVTTPEGMPLTSHGRRPFTYFSVFGKIVFWRHAFTAPGQPVVCPVDATLSLPRRCYSDLLREWTTFAAADAPFREVAALLERVLGGPFSVQALETITGEDAGDVAAYYEQPPAAPPPAEAVSILVAQADGKGVPLVLPPPAERPARRGKGSPSNRLREAVVTALYSILPYRRTPEDVAAALLREATRPELGRRPRPVGKELRATLDGKDAALERLAGRVQQRESPQIQDRVALTDGAAALQERMRSYLPGFTLVLDIIHVTEYLWDAANAVLGERHPERTDWVRGHLTTLLSGRTNEVVAALEVASAAPELAPARREAVERTIGYYRRNTPYMHYDQYLAAGWPIGTGVVEGACGHLVKDRMEQAGMRWTKDGAHAVLDLRALRLTDDWDAYWVFHRQREHQRLYGSALAPAAPPEDQALVLEAAA